MLTGLAQYKLLFMAQLLFGEGMFLFRLERQRRFGLRLAVTLPAMFLLTGCFPIVHYNAWYISFLFLALFGCSLLAMRLCYDEPWENLLFCGIAGYTVQHLAYLLYTLISEATQIGLLFGAVFDPYSNTTFDLTKIPAIQVVFYIDCYFLVYAFAFTLFDRLLEGNHDLRLGRTDLVALSGLLIVADVIFNMITNYYTTGSRISLLLERSYNILICVLILALLYNQLSRRELKAELDGVQHLVEQGKKQYELAKKSVDLVNMKYHDLRHQSELLHRRGTLALEEKAELDRVLEEYVAQVKTGNEVLDTILTEKTMLCQGRGIRLICIADGRGLGFIKAHHLYALLGNAIDNAIDAVQALPQDQQDISLSIKSIGSLVSIHVENRYSGAVSLREGLPVTTKGDRDFHGFGMLSIKTIAERYGGTVTVSTEDGVFSLDVMMANDGSEESPSDGS
ncbi:ATPase/histidine kinase/DNA gyrase B/HSP90 domain protein [uncultured Eubacteriales bacterium]|uniref:ATPase/histidine kinase/DNA gyrase B/HSP90 domain protein n=1 Tax=uncultured Eubacteriales bacterium TaxID=172733 RepID=A0A212KFB0_9FIRM|nr:ATPase/histidine kinase/DNA gyrase B/HSP90 domain protein [uncultured Eubacteriales bacterium]